MKLWGWLSIVIAVLLGLIKIKSYEHKKLDEEYKEAEDAISQSEYNHGVDLKNSLNQEAYIREKEKMNEPIDNNVSKSYDA